MTRNDTDTDNDTASHSFRLFIDNELFSAGKEINTPLIWYFLSYDVIRVVVSH